MHGHRCFSEFVKYTTLNVMGMIGLSCYILADTFFVSRSLGANGLTALNLSIPVYSFIHGSGLMIGMGGATRYTVFKSQGQDSAAHQVFAHAVYLAGAFAAAFVMIGLFFSGHILSLFGAQQAVLSMSKTYLRVILLFAPAFLLNNVLLCFVRNDGSPHLSMAAMIGGSLSNVVLDWVFLFSCQMGIFGAAFATGLAPFISMGILLPHFLGKRNSLRLIQCRPKGSVVAGLLSSGVPSLVTEVSSGVVMIAFNAMILHLQGDVGVAAYGIIANLSLVVIAIFTGIAQGIQPLLSRSYGSKNGKDVHTISRYAMLTMLALSLLLYIGVFFGAEQITGVFNREQNVLLQQIAEQGLRLYFLACPFAGFNILLSMYFTSTQSPRPAHVISLLRGFFLILPMAFLLTWLWKMQGVWCAFPVTELLTAGLGAVLYRMRKRRLTDDGN